MGPMAKTVWSDYAVSLILAEWWPERDGSLTGWLPDFGNKEMADTTKALAAYIYIYIYI